MKQAKGKEANLHKTYFDHWEDDTDFGWYSCKCGETFSEWLSCDMDFYEWSRLHLAGAVFPTHEELASYKVSIYDTLDALRKQFPLAVANEILSLTIELESCRIEEEHQPLSESDTMTVTAYDREAAMPLISDIYHAARVLENTPIFNQNDYLDAAVNFTKANLALVQLHRNWNEKTGEVNQHEDDYDEIPFGWEKPVVEFDDLDPVEDISDDLYRNSQYSLKLLEPTISTLSSWEIAKSYIHSIITYHYAYNERNGELDTER